MSKTKQIKAIRGMNDVLPQNSQLWLDVERCCQEVLSQRAFKQIRMPIVESTHLFARSIGAETDIVAKEMYTFEDRNGDSLTLRPEGTASCVRAGIEHGLFYNQQQRLWYIGPMFRHERPQKGRYRQFHQIGAEAYGWSSPDVEAEILALIAQIFSRLGLQKTQLQINSLGDAQSRTNYRQALVEYLSDKKSQLDDDSLRRLTSNPLRILDSKNSQVQAALEDAPSILDFLSEDSSQNFELLQDYLNELDIPFSVNSRLVRGLDYYNDTVFEWVNEDFGAQSTVCAGGRYDSMVEQLGGVATPGFGFAMGLERLVQILEEQQAPVVMHAATPDVYLISQGEPARAQSLRLQKNLTQFQGDHAICAQLHCGGGSLKNQFKKADKSGAKLAIVIAEQEAEDRSATVKVLVPTETLEKQQTIKQIDVVNVVTNLLESL